MSRYKINNLEEYFKEYKKSVREPKKFWDKIASENFTWYQHCLLYTSPSPRD